MSLVTALSNALLGVGVLAVLLSCLGVLLVPDAYDKLHYAGPANTVGTVAIVAAIVVRAGFGQAGVKAIVVALVLLSTNAALTHATARAATIRARRNGAGLGAGPDIPTDVGMPRVAGTGDGQGHGGHPGGKDGDPAGTDPAGTDPTGRDADDTGDDHADHVDDSKETGPA
jgi:multicomponent Na+:H+ antiporter subunit G